MRDSKVSTAAGLRGAPVKLLVVVLAVSLLAASLGRGAQASGVIGGPPTTPNRGTTCAAGVSSSNLHSYFAQERAGLVGLDYQRPFRLSDGRVLWLFQDAFVRRGGRVVLLHNAGVVQSGRCFSLLTGRNRTDWLMGSRTIAERRWFWPLGGAMGADGHFHLFMAEMVERGSRYLSNSEPVATHRVVIRVKDLAVLGSVPAADSSAELFGWSVTNDDQFTYLYSHCHRQFGFDPFPWGGVSHDRDCTPDVKVARVPLGKLWERPSYWDGRNWQADRSRAVPVIPRESMGHQRVVNPAQIMYTGDQFVAITKDGDWWGTKIYLDRALEPEGPWTTYHSMPSTAKCPERVCNTYFASFVPWRNGDGSLIAGLSNNRWDGRLSSYYRPSFFAAPPPPKVVTPKVPGPIAPSRPGRLVPLASCRLFDSTSDPAAKLAAGKAVVVAATGRCGIPAGATAVSLSITASDPSAAGVVTLTPAGRGRSVSSTLTVGAGERRSNGAVVKLGAGGAIELHSTVAAHVTVDVAAAFVPAPTSKEGRFVAIDPVAVLDTSTAGVPLPGTTLTAARPAQVPPDAVAVALVVTSAGAATSGDVVVYPTGADRPAVTSVAVDGSGRTRTTGLLQPIGPNGLSIHTTAGGHLSLQVTGYFTGPSAAAGTSGLFVADDPVRIFDSRTHIPALGPGVARRLRAGVVAGSAVLNLSMIGASGGGFLTVWATGRNRPELASVQAQRPGDPVAGLTVPALGPGGQFSVYASNGSDVAVDRVGWFLM